MFYFKWTLLSLVFFFLASCGIPTPGSEVVAMNSNEISMISNTAETTSSVFRSGENTTHFCSSTSPDSTFSASSSTGLSISTLNLGGGAPESGDKEISDSGDEMIGRTPAVVAARDIMYRACEMIGNLELSNQDALAVYSESLAAATSILAIEVSSTTIEQRSALGIVVSNTPITIPPINITSISDDDDYDQSSDLESNSGS